VHFHPQMEYNFNRFFNQKPASSFYGSWWNKKIVNIK